MVYRIGYIYGKAKERGLVRGRDPHLILAAAAYIVFKESGVINTLSELAFILQIRRKQLAKNYRLMINKLVPKISLNDPLLAQRCKIGEETRLQAEILMKYSKRTGFLAGKNPISIAASVLCIACVITSEYRSQRGTAQAAGITDDTLRNRIKVL
jgi:transcription initiation factor TFIIB